MRNHEFVSDGFPALIVTALVLLCSGLLVIALLAWLWRTSSPPKPLVTLKSRGRSIMYAKRLDAINSRRRKWRTTTS
jgi:hypothetical protein